MRRIIEWVLWDRNRLAITAVTVAVLFMGTLALFGGADPTTAKAAPTTSSTATATGWAPAPDLGTPAPLPTLVTPTESAPPPIGATRTAGLDRAEVVADTFMRTYLDVRALDRAQWEARLLPISGASMPDVVRSIPESMIPAARVVRAIWQPGTGEKDARVNVALSNGDTYVVLLTKDAEGRWLVTSAAPYGGEE